MPRPSVLTAGFLLAALAPAGCDDRPASPSGAAPTASAGSTDVPVSAGAIALGPALTAPASASAATPPAPTVVGARQILVAYKGAELAPRTVTRSPADARRRAEEALARLKKDGLPFAEVARKYSDDEPSRNAGGALGNFERGAMPPAFAQAAFALGVGEISDVVETPRGFAVIERTR